MRGFFCAGNYSGDEDMFPRNPFCRTKKTAGSIVLLHAVGNRPERSEGQDCMLVFDRDPINSRTGRYPFERFHMTIHPQGIDRIVAMTVPTAGTIRQSVIKTGIIPQRDIVCFKHKKFIAGLLHRTEFERLIGTIIRSLRIGPIPGSPLEFGIAALRPLHSTGG